MKDKKKCLLKIYAIKHKETGQVYIDWKFPDKCKIFSLIGILETIKYDLINYNDEQSMDSEVNQK